MSDRTYEKRDTVTNQEGGKRVYFNRFFFSIDFDIPHNDRSTTLLLLHGSLYFHLVVEVGSVGTDLRKCSKLERGSKELDRLLHFLH